MRRKQDVRGEGLLQQIGIRIEPALVDDGIVGVARHEEHRKSWPVPQEASDQLPPAHLRHHDISQQEVNRSLVACRQLERKLGRRREEHRIALLFQHSPDHGANPGIVLNHENRC